MRKQFKLTTPRYTVESVSGNYFDVFNKRANAIQSAIELATQYPSTTFIVVKKVLHKRDIVFTYMVEMQVHFDDLKNTYQKIIEVYQSKLDKMKYWRKANGDAT